MSSCLSVATARFSPVAFAPSANSARGTNCISWNSRPQGRGRRHQRWSWTKTSTFIHKWFHIYRDAQGNVEWRLADMTHGPRAETYLRFSYPSLLLFPINEVQILNFIGFQEACLKSGRGHGLKHEGTPRNSSGAPHQGSSGTPAWSFRALWRSWAVKGNHNRQQQFWTTYRFGEFWDGTDGTDGIEFLGDHFEPRPLGFVTPIELEGHVWGAPKGTTVICNLRKSWIIHIPIEITIEISIENTHVEWSIYLNLPFVVTNEVYPAPIASHPCDRGSTPETLRNLPRFWRLERSNELILNS